VGGDEEFDEGVLGEVGVLVFVDEDEVPAGLVGAEDRGVVLEELDGEEEEIVEVEGVALFEFGLIEGVELLGEGIFGRCEVIFGSGDVEADLFEEPFFFGEGELLEAVFEEFFAVVFVVDGEVGLVAKVMDRFAEDTGAEAVEGGGEHLGIF